MMHIQYIGHIRYKNEAQRLCETPPVSPVLPIVIAYLLAQGSGQLRSNQVELSKKHTRLF